MPRISKTFREKRTPTFKDFIKSYGIYALIWLLILFLTNTPIVFTIISSIVMVLLIAFYEFRKHRYFIFKYEFQGMSLYLKYRKGNLLIEDTIPLKDLRIEIGSEYTLSRTHYLHKTIILRWENKKVEQTLSNDWTVNEMLFLEKTFHDAVHWKNGDRIS